jgi:small subunit ribosomal protein S3
MGQKIHPVGLRLGITRTWESRWFEKKNYRAWLHEDTAIRKYFGRLTRAAGISKVEIERRANQARVIVHTAKPGIIIGKRGVGIEDIRKNLEHLTQKNVQVNVVEIKHPELDARLVGQNIVDQLEKRIAFRRAIKQSIMRTMKAGARGVKVMVSGRLGGAEIARSAQDHDGKVPLHTLRADIDYAHVEAFTTFGRIGVKVWIYKGEVLPEAPRNEQREPERPGERAQFRDRRNDRRGGRGRGPGAGPAPAGAQRPATPGDGAVPVAEATAPIAEASAPSVASAAPVVESAAPVSANVAPVVESAAPVVEAASPGVESAAPVVDAAAPVVEAAAPAVEAAAPVIETPPVVEAATPAETAPAAAAPEAAPQAEHVAEPGEEAQQ